MTWFNKLEKKGLFGVCSELHTGRRSTVEVQYIQLVMQGTELFVRLREMIRNRFVLEKTSPVGT